LRAELLQLLTRRGPRQIGGDEARRFLLELQASRELGRRRRLAGPLEPDEQHHGRPDRSEL
jgi:hypothetical protein